MNFSEEVNEDFKGNYRKMYFLNFVWGTDFIDG